MPRASVIIEIMVDVDHDDEVNPQNIHSSMFITSKPYGDKVKVIKTHKLRQTSYLSGGVTPEEEAELFKLNREESR